MYRSCGVFLRTTFVWCFYTLYNIKKMKRSRVQRTLTSTSVMKQSLRPIKISFNIIEPIISILSTISKKIHFYSCHSPKLFIAHFRSVGSNLWTFVGPIRQSCSHCFVWLFTAFSVNYSTLNFYVSTWTENKASWCVQTPPHISDMFTPCVGLQQKHDIPISNTNYQ